MGRFRLANRENLRGGFLGRLLLTLAMTLVFTGVLDFALREPHIRASFLDSSAQRHADDARSVERAFAEARSDEDPLKEAGKLLRAMGARKGLRQARLIDGRRRVTWSTGGTTASPASHRETAVGAALRGGSTNTVGDGGLALTAPVVLDGRRYALHIHESSAALDEAMTDARLSAGILALLGLLVAVPLFYILGGRRLSRIYDVAVNRARRDGLTDLDNHRSFQDEVERAFAAAERSDADLSLAVLDVDDFKLVNDRRGHRHGDLLLVEIAEVLRGGRTADRAFRLGGDEFAVLLTATGPETARTAVDRLHRRLAERAGTDATVSVGIASRGPGAADPEALWERADAAMYEAKRRGHGRAVCASELVGAAGEPTGEQRRALQSILDHGTVDVAFQPIWELGGSTLLGYEALARPDARHGFAGPGDAFDAADRLGKGHELDTVCRDSALRRATELPGDALLFLNLSPQSLDRDALVGDTLVDAVHAAGLTPERVVLELTERSSAQGEHVVREADRLRALGFRLALDDVGAGNAGLEMLRALRVDFIKVDRMVVSGAMTDPGARGVFAAILAFAGQSGAYVIAEGIEDDAMLDFVRHGTSATIDTRVVRGAQGYLLGRPAAEVPFEPMAPDALVGAFHARAAQLA